MAALRSALDAWCMNAILVRSGREAAYLTAGLLTSILAFTVWISCVTLSLSLAVFIIGLPIMLASAYVFRWTADLDRRSVSLFLGRRVRGRYQDHRADTFLGRLAATFRDAQTWRDFSWLTVHSIVGFAFGVAALSLIGSVLYLAFLPVFFWALPEGGQFGLWNADTLPVAIASAFLAIPAAAITIVLLRWMAWTEALIATALLGPRRVLASR
jgi:putative sensor protein